MFDQNPSLPPRPNVPPTPAPSATPQPPPVEDIFSQTEAPGAPRIGRPVQPGEAQVMPMTGDVFGRRSIWDNKLLIILLAVVALAIIGGIVWAAVSFLVPKEAPVNENLNLPTNANVNVNANANVNAEVNANANENVNAPEVINPEINANINAPVAMIDSDNDGLSDDEEAQLGTDPLNFDTDGDGLVDRVEVRIYKSDPLNKDTDGDGYDDGTEVRNGYDPTKPGTARLFNVP